MDVLDEENLNSALSIGVSLKEKILNTTFGFSDGHITSWTRDIIFTLYCTCTYYTSIKFTFGELHFKNISDKL